MRGKWDGLVVDRSVLLAVKFKKINDLDHIPRLGDVDVVLNYTSTVFAGMDLKAVFHDPIFWRIVNRAVIQVDVAVPQPVGTLVSIENVRHFGVCAIFGRIIHGLDPRHRCSG